MLQSLEFSKKDERKVVGKKMSISTSLDFESKIAMHSPFLKASKAALKVCFSILLV
jgi:hypothetical protein